MGAEDCTLDTQRFTSPFGIDLQAPTRGQTPSAAYSVQIGTDGRGRVFDNLFVERLWRTVNEDIYLRDYGSVAELDPGLARYFRFYNQERLHQSLGGAWSGHILTTTGPTCGQQGEEVLA